MYNNGLRNVARTKYKKDIDPWFLNFLKIFGGQKQAHDSYQCSNFPKYLDPRTGEPKFDSYIPCFVDPDKSTDHTP